MHIYIYIYMFSFTYDTSAKVVKKQQNPNDLVPQELCEHIADAAQEV